MKAMVVEGVLGDAWLRAVWEAATDAMALSDPAGRVLAANPAYYRLYGFSPEEVVGHSFAIIFPEPEREQAEARYQSIFHGPPTQGPFDAIVRRRDSTERNVQSRIYFLDVAGQRAAMLSVVRDTTAEVAAQRRAEHTERARQDFLSSLSHDIRSPLAVIKGHAQLLRRRVSREAAEHNLDQFVVGLTQIEASALQVASLVDELIEMSALGSGATPPLHYTEADLVALAREVVERYQYLAVDHRLELRTPVPALQGRWDAARLLRVLDNVIGNAVKYSPEGGDIRVSITPDVPFEAHGPPSTQHGPERASTSPMPDPALPGVLLSVEDTGIGIDASDLPHVFERFRRGQNVSGTVGGSGIGLSSVQQIVQQHGGRVRIDSVVGKGTTVSIWLPLRPVAEGTA